MTGDGAAGEARRYAACAVLSAGVMLGLPVALHEGLGLGERVAVGVTYVVGFVLNFYLARVIVFRSPGAWGPQLARFALTSAAVRVAEYAAFLLLHGLAGNATIAEQFRDPELKGLDFSETYRPVGHAAQPEGFDSALFEVQEPGQPKTGGAFTGWPLRTARRSWRPKRPPR